MDRVGDLIQVLKKKDNHVAIINQLNKEQNSYTKTQLPAELENLQGKYVDRFHVGNKEAYQQD